MPPRPDRSSAITTDQAPTGACVGAGTKTSTFLEDFLVPGARTVYWLALIGIVYLGLYTFLLGAST